MWLARALLTALAIVLLPWSPASAAPAAKRPRPCTAGLVALTFDDGPARGVTPRLVGILRERRVPATFFMVGSRVRSAPAQARLVARNGFQIANHTWSHPALPTLDNRAIADQLRSTARALRKARVEPGPLMRPPYGALDGRVRRVIKRVGLVPVLWNVDSNDWRGGSSRQIADRVLGQLRRGGNIVLQHDGVTNSPASVGAVPRIVREARKRGYCFTDLTDGGRARVPVPGLTATTTAGREAGLEPIVVRLTLDRPTSRPVSVVVTTGPGSNTATATPGADYVPVSRRVRFRTGVTHAKVTIPVLDDLTAEDLETVTVTLSRPRGLTVRTPSVSGSVVSDDLAAPPETRLSWADSAIWRVVTPLR